MASLFGEYPHEVDLTVGIWRGFPIPWREEGVWVLCTYHPSYLLREQSGAAERIVRQDLSLLPKLLLKPLPQMPDGALEDRVRFLEEEEAIRVLSKMRSSPPPLLTFDYETTGKKPFRPGHQILCCGFSTDPDSASVFWLGDQASKELVGAWRAVLESEAIAKTAHNMKFEELWSRYILGSRIASWAWDSMLGAHFLDNREGITNLEFQSIRHFGVFGYKHAVSRFLTSPASRKEAALRANGFNKATSAPRNQLMMRCGLDALFERRLAEIQMRELGEWKWK
jgi:hypothetical protein